MPSASASATAPASELWKSPWTFKQASAGIPAFLPGYHPGTPPGRDKVPAKEATLKLIRSAAPADLKTRQLHLLRAMNDDALRDAGGADADMEARIRSFETASRMQVEAPDVLHLAGETKATRVVRAGRRRDGRLRHAVPVPPPARGVLRTVIRVSTGFKWDQRGGLSRVTSPTRERRTRSLPPG